MCCVSRELLLSGVDRVQQEKVKLHRLHFLCGFLIGSKADESGESHKHIEWGDKHRLEKLLALCLGEAKMHRVRIRAS